MSFHYSTRVHGFQVSVFWLIIALCRVDGVFNLVVADFNLAMLKKRTEARLLV